MSDEHTPRPDDENAFAFDTLTEQPLQADEADSTPVPDDTEVKSPTKTTSSRAPSRTTRVLLGGLLLALAAFVWFNYFWQPQQPTVQVGTPQPPGGNGIAGGPGAVPLVSGQQDAAEQPLAGPESDADADAAVVPSPVAAPDAAAGQEDGADDASGAVPFVPVDTPVGVVARDLVVSDLPFLVTVAPVEPEAQLVEDDPEALRPTAQRASINPFSPVVLATPASQQAFAGPVPDAVAPDSADAVDPDSVAQPEVDPVIEVSIPSGPDQQAITTVVSPGSAAIRTTPVTPASQQQLGSTPVQPAVSAPAPQVAAPAPAPVAGSTVAQSLPRQLPGPALSPVPQVLQERRAVEDVPQPNLAQVAATSEPVADAAAPEGSVDAPLPSEPALSLADDPREPLEPVASRIMPSEVDPLVAGVTPLSRYLRDYNVTFTGVVLGPISQGVFRTMAHTRPVVVALGQELPETEIVLTDLRGQEAEFTLAGATQTLTLELRR